jgi:hypothetical protein
MITVTYNKTKRDTIDFVYCKTAIRYMSLLEIKWDLWQIWQSVCGLEPNTEYKKIYLKYGQHSEDELYLLRSLHWDRARDDETKIQV